MALSIFKRPRTFNKTDQTPEAGWGRGRSHRCKLPFVDGDKAIKFQPTNRTAVFKILRFSTSGLREIIYPLYYLYSNQVALCKNNMTRNCVVPPFCDISTLLSHRSSILVCNSSRLLHVPLKRREIRLTTGKKACFPTALFKIIHYHLMYFTIPIWYILTSCSLAMQISSY